MYQGYRYIDSDSHVMEPPDMWENYLDAEFRGEMPRHWTGYRGDPYSYVLDVWVGGWGLPDFLAGRAAPVPGVEAVYREYQDMGFSPEAYRLVLERSGMDAIVLYPSVGLFVTAVPTLHPATAAAYRRAYNTWLADFCTGDSRLVGVGTVDLRDPVEAAREARRCVERLGFKAIMINPDPVTAYPLFDPFHDPLWDAIQDLDVPLAIHEGAGTPINVGAQHFYHWAPGRGVAGFVMGNMLASLALIGGGVLERFPRMRVVHLEVGCGWVPYWMDRMQAGIQGANRQTSRFIPLEGLTMHPADYFRRQCYVAADPDDPQLGYVVETLGDDNIVTSSDFGHPEGRGYVHAIEETLALTDVSDTTKRKIMWDNPAHLYGITG